MPTRSLHTILFTLLILLICPLAGADPAEPITLPVEVMGAAGTTRAVSVTLPARQAAQVTGLWMQVHSLGYANKASVKIDNGPWTPLNNQTVLVAEPGKSYGGIGGGFATLTLTLPLRQGAVSGGANTLRFRFNGTDGISVGYRVLAFNFVTRTGQRLLPPDTFVQDDPNTWTPPLAEPLAAAIGRRLWYSAPLKLSPLQAKTT